SSRSGTAAMSNFTPSPSPSLSPSPSPVGSPSPDGSASPDDSPSVESSLSAGGCGCGCDDVLSPPQPARAASKQTRANEGLVTGRSYHDRRTRRPAVRVPRRSKGRALRQRGAGADLLIAAGSHDLVRPSLRALEIGPWIGRMSHDEPELSGGEVAKRRSIDAPAVPVSRYDLLCFSHLRWDFVFQRPQHLLTRCARERRVFFFEE